MNTKKTNFIIFHTPQRKVIVPEIEKENTKCDRVSEFNFMDIDTYDTSLINSMPPN